MPDTIIKWTDPNISETGYDVYSSADPISLSALPVPVTLTANTVQYLDTSLNLGDIKNYRIGARYNTERRNEWISANKKFTAGNLDMYMDFEQNFMYDHATQDTPSMVTRITDTGSESFIPTKAGLVFSPTNTLSISDSGLTTQPTRTNLALRSNALTTAPNNVIRATVTPSAFVAPTGSPYWLVTCNTTNVNPASAPQGISGVVAGTYTVSYFVKRSTSDWVGIYVFNQSDSTKILFSHYNIVTGAFGGQGQGGTDFTFIDRRMTFYPDGSVRIELTISINVDMIFSPRPSVIDGNAAVCTIGTATYFTDVQVELGAFATLPIVTTTAAVTRSGNRQILDLTGRLSEGVAGFIKYDKKAVSGSVERILHFSGSNTTADRLGIFHNSGSLGMTSSSNSSQDGTAGNLGASVSGLTTLVFALSQNFLTIRVVGGVQSTVDTAVTYPNLEKASFGGNGTSTAENGYQTAKTLALKFGPQNQASFDAMYALAQLETVEAPQFL